MDSVVDYTNYSKEELFEVLENIDDLLFPENAIKIYSILSNEFYVTENDILSRYQNDGALISILKIVLFPVLGAPVASKDELAQKINRIKVQAAIN